MDDKITGCLFCVIIVMVGVYMFTQPDNFYEHTKMRRKGQPKVGDPTKLDFIFIRGGGIFFIIAGIGFAIASLFNLV